jgi:small subunit ribosomal protein S1
LLYIEDISVARIKTPAERLKVGQKINVVVKDIDRDKNRVYFSYKEMLGTWEENVEDLEEKAVVPGIIRETEKDKRGIFVELKPNLVGMAEYREGMQYGQKVDVYVKKIVKEKKKIKLIIKSNNDN